MRCSQCDSTEWVGTTGPLAESDGYVRCVPSGHKLSNEEFNRGVLEEQQKANGTWREPTYTLEQARAMLAAEVSSTPVGEPVDSPALAHPDILDVPPPPAMDAAPPAPVEDDTETDKG